MGNEVRVRYAPSPTGHLHIGNARTALLTIYLPAAKAESLLSGLRIRTKSEILKAESKASSTI